MTTHDTKFIFATLEKADVSISCFAKLTGVSRQSLQNWKAGHPISDEIRWKIAYNAASRLALATQAGSLPLKDPMSAKETAATVKRIMMTVKI